MNKILKIFILPLLAMLSFLISPVKATEFIFASKDKAIEILTADDEYLTNMQAIEIALRVSSPTADKTIDDLKAHFTENVSEWSAAEIALIKALLVTHKKKLEKISHLLPDNIYFVKVTDKVEGGIPHTRANAFISPDRITSYSTSLFFHQLFHILSREQRVRRALLYDIIEFKPCYFQTNELIDKYSIKDPETPLNEFYLPVEIEGRDTAVISYLHTTKEGFDPSIEGGFNSHISGDLMEVSVNNGVCTPVNDKNGNPNILKHESIPDFYDKVGRNVKYVIHPEEIMAGNFALLMKKKKNLLDPDIPEDLEEWLER
ncbi:MAG: hypothetical protein HOM01_01030 [Kordiimonadaceae bacterium]|nr:hypothetical protein [Kordiimonadaceae bacterium]